MANEHCLSQFNSIKQTDIIAFPRCSFIRKCVHCKYWQFLCRSSSASTISVDLNQTYADWMLLLFIYPILFFNFIWDVLDICHGDCGCVECKLGNSLCSFSLYFFNRPARMLILSHLFIEHTQLLMTNEWKYISKLFIDKNCLLMSGS